MLPGCTSGPSARVARQEPQCTPHQQIHLLHDSSGCLRYSSIFGTSGLTTEQKYKLLEDIVSNPELPPAKYKPLDEHMQPACQFLDGEPDDEDTGPAAPALTDNARDMPQDAAAATQAVPAPVQRRQNPAPRNRTPHAAAAPRRQRRVAACAASSDDEAAPSARAAAAPGVQRKSGRTRVADLRVANAMLMLQVDSDSEGQGDCDTSADYLG